MPCGPNLVMVKYFATIGTQVEEADIVIPRSCTRRTRVERANVQDAGNSFARVAMQHDIGKSRRLRYPEDGCSRSQADSLRSNFFRRLARVAASVDEEPSILIQQTYAIFEQRPGKLVCGPPCVA